MRHGMSAVLVLVTLSASAASHFVSPQPNAQVLGRTTLEIATDATEIDRVEFYVDGTLAGVVRAAPYRIVYDFATSLDPHHLVAQIRSHHFERQDVAELRTAAVGGESITVNLVEVPLRIRSQTTITPKDISVVEDKVRQTIRDVLPDRPPARFVFLVDRSQSMREGKLASALAAVDTALELLRPNDTAQIIFFNHNFGQLEDLPRGTRVSERYAALDPSGGTSLRDAVVSTITPERTNTIVITDGTDRNSEIAEEVALRRLSGTNSVFFSLVFDEASRFLRNASQNTGGTIATVTAATAQRAMRELMEDINSRYTLTYQSSGKKKGWREIRITSTRSGVAILNARKGYFAE